MSPPVRLLIHGATGRMGRALLRLCREEGLGCTVVAAVARHAPQETGVPGFAVAELDDVPDFDVAVDFSLPDGFDTVLALCLARRTALVSGTTGLSEGQQAALDAAAARIPLVWASNYSLGVAVLQVLVSQAAGLLHGWDCDIVESHHAHKKDAPSGTALTLGASAQTAGVVPHYASIRAGDIVGEHLVQFTGTGERIELIHRASSRDIFARGALHAARRLHGREPGRYPFENLV
ncbi:4-hydroxy-tetrahydrodipicolinate reductase [Thermomonas sp.]|uniref:4-hydroxy-tetrahydrodipicolinate reductase n=1 Tax=Thermomonas sp. TaxID=1971895 RepID=UPI001DE1A45D|nr:4-hydroxy-tetrahydrodipicolinate reductase [Thermomonas sp.]MBZ0088362.1 4-hydroxy-tetrahydrodipicolinate reductase [Thermomonas sp.]HRO62901.1 4-hydroxy-tetrahydrodipicolinate reductase [Thermomonas sp.]